MAGEEIEGGRPRKAASLTVRLTEATRAALETAAIRDGRSTSEMAERWLSGEGRLHARGYEITQAIMTMLEFARRVEAEVGNPKESLPARDALIAGWKGIMEHMLPFTPDTTEGAEFKVLRAEIAILCHEILTRAVDDDADKETVSFMFSPPDRPMVNAAKNHAANALAGFGGADTSPLYQLFQRISKQPMIADVNALKRRLAATDNLPAELAVPISELCPKLDKFGPLFDAYMRPRWSAVKRGETIAETMMARDPLE